MTDENDKRDEDIEVELNRRYCEELQKRILDYERDPRNFFKLNKRGGERYTRAILNRG